MLTKHYLYTILTKDGEFFNAVSKKSPGLLAIDMLTSGVVIINCEKISRDEYDQLQEIMEIISTQTVDTN